MNPNEKIAKNAWRSDVIKVCKYNKGHNQITLDTKPIQKEL